MSDSDGGRDPEERAYQVGRRERSRQMRDQLRNLEGHLRDMDGHLRELDEHLRHEVEESERWHRKWDDPPEGG